MSLEPLDPRAYPGILGPQHGDFLARYNAHLAEIEQRLTAGAGRLRQMGRNFDTQAALAPAWNAAPVVNNGFARVTLGRLPADFQQLVAVVFSFRPTNTVTAEIEFVTSWVGAGELWNANGESDLTSTYAVETNVQREIDLVGLFTGVAAGDEMGVQAQNKLGATLYAFDCTAYFL